MATKINKQKHVENETSNLKGTLISVMVLGMIILISWFGVFALFLSR
ncbi:cytochrome c oxidase subunit 2A [Virgibacillus soli]|uniref:Cytochrome c oxidase subunit 2A n=1 Tax=Paracerasibacillus soli TaxID=480284 RepID=A0ABU5CQZ8_9BACI|nr:cytochrome c oxidase subunit 2A [Virgibacillus soli]MDY0408281.1 cytochrome c oxidase subunit 2A [Virgibacillus soli]